MITRQLQDDLIGSSLAKEAMKRRLRSLMTKIKDNPDLLKKIPRQHARILRACMVAKENGTPITPGMFEVMTRYA